jgi:hypothetical protein
MIDRVTITGADDSVTPGDLALLSEDFPYVEWGILASASRSTGEPRYPTLAWMETFREMAIENRMQASLHLCGRFTRLILIGELDRIVLQLVNGFGRMQLNFQSSSTPCDPIKALKVLHRIRACSAFGENLQFLFQLDGTRGNDHLEALCLEHVNAYGEPSNMFGLFDSSGGLGLLPGEWPAPIYHSEGVYDYHGYAGGLGPDNLAREIPRILKAAVGCQHIWIDMESGVRSDDGRFDLRKARRCLEIAEPFVGKP